MEVQVTVDIPDAIMQDALMVLAEKHSINITRLQPHELIDEVAQAVADDVLRSIGNDLVNKKALEERTRLETYIPTKQVFWPAPEISIEDIEKPE